MNTNIPNIIYRIEPLMNPTDSYSSKDDKAMQGSPPRVGTISSALHQWHVS